MRGRATLIATIAAAALAGAILLPSAATADTSIYCSPDCDVVVNSTVDAPDANPGDGTCATADGACTLRAAVQEGNAAGVANVLVRPGHYVLSRHGLDDDASHGDLDIAFHGQLVGAGPSETVVDGDDADRVFDLHIGEVRVAHLTARDGRATDGPGGGIRTGVGELSYYGRLEYLRVTDNVAVAGEAAGSGNGGGISASRDTLAVYNQVDHNEAVNGGGMYWSGGQADTGGSTYSNNYASGDGGGIYLTGTDTGFGNTTISGNRADGHGGGARVPVVDTAFGFVRIDASTIASNSAPSGMGGGLWIEGTPPDESASTMTGSIIARNGGGGDCAGGARYESRGGNVDGDGSCGFQDPTDLAEVDPLLGPLADNGGPTLTRELLEGSPAIDAWSTGCGGTDQRSVARPQGAACDSGAFEVGPCCPAYEAPYVPPDEPPVEPPAPPREGDCGVLRFGTAAADVLAGDRRHNQIYGRAGDDSIYGRFQSDCLYAGAGDDFVRGGQGTDLLVGFTGADHLSGGDQEDVVRGGRGPDRILGGADEDRLLGGPGADYIKGGDGYDTIKAGPGDDTIDAAGGGLDTVDCGPGEDRVRAKRGERLAGCEHVHYVDGAA